MPNSWVFDINYAVFGDGKHWTTNPPAPVNGSLDDYWHQNLSHNLLSQLFHMRSFGWYYTSTINEVSLHFHDRFDTVPTSNTDLLRLAHFTEGDISIAKSLLQRIARHPLSTRRMQELYLHPFDTQLDPIVDIFEILQLNLKWICIPFVALRQDIRAGLLQETDRPNSDMLQWHIHGDPTSSREALGPRNYEEFLQLDLSESGKRIARDKAFEERFFDSISPQERARGIRYAMATCDDSVKLAAVGAPSLYGARWQEPEKPQGGGNGYKCVGGVCKPAAATDYCISTSCS